MENPYKTLGVSDDATLEQITLAYRRMSSKHHPDRNGGDTTKQQEINAAFETLSNAAKRAEWDESGGSSARRLATELLRQEFSVLINLNREGDLVKAVRDQVESKRRNAIMSKSNAKTMIAKLNKKLAALKGPTLGNVFTAVLENEIKKHEFGIQQCDDAIEAIDLAVTILQAYSWKEENRDGVNPFQLAPQSVGAVWWQKD